MLSDGKLLNDDKFITSLNYTHSTEGATTAKEMKKNYRLSLWHDVSSVVCLSVRLSVKFCIVAKRYVVLDAQTQNGDEPVGEYSFSGRSCLPSADS